MDILIETPRLIIRPLLAGDDEGMFEMDSKPEVMEYVGRKPVQTIEESREVIRYVQQQYTDNGIGRWAMIEKGSNAFVGWTGFKLITATVHGRSNFIDFGYRLTPAFWGRGLATEAAIASLHYGIDKLGFKDIYAMTHVDNGASRHILEKIGFALRDIFPYDSSDFVWQQLGMPTTWYQYTQGDKDI